MRKNLILVLLFVLAFLFKSESVFASSASIELKGDGGISLILRWKWTRKKALVE